MTCFPPVVGDYCFKKAASVTQTGTSFNLKKSKSRLLNENSQGNSLASGYGAMVLASGYGEIIMASGYGAIVLASGYGEINCVSLLRLASISVCIHHSQNEEHVKLIAYANE